MLDPLNYIMFTTSQADADAYLAALNAFLGYPKPDYIDGRGHLKHGDISYSAVEAIQDPVPPNAWRVNIPDDNGGIFDAGPPATISSSGDGWPDPASYNGVPVSMPPDDPAWVLPVPELVGNSDT